MNKTSSIRKKLIKQKRQWSFLLLLTFGIQAMFAQGLMAGQGTWVELCTGDSASVSLVYLSDSTSQNDHSEHQAETTDHCLFSSVSNDIIQEVDHSISTQQIQFLVSENFHPFANRQFWPTRSSRAPPAA